MKRILLVVIVVALIAGAGFVALNWDFTKRSVQGYSAASTPQDAADKFKKALKERDYK
jgi:hypothetical protein